MSERRKAVIVGGGFGVLSADEQRCSHRLNFTKELSEVRAAREIKPESVNVHPNRDQPLKPALNGQRLQTFPCVPFAWTQISQFPCRIIRYNLCDIAVTTEGRSF
jgi:hypothetical protein